MATIVRRNVRHRTNIVFTIFAAMGIQRTTAKRATGRYLVYVGTYTGTNSRGIYANQFDSNTGAIAQMGLAAETENPSFLAIHPSGRYLYAVNEVEHFQGEPSGAISAFAIDFGSGKLRLLNQIASLGAGPAHISLDLNGRHAFVANYGAGNVAVFALEQDGRFGKSTALVQHCGSGLDPDRQFQPHPHCVALSPDNRFALVADLGLDRLFSYRFDHSTGMLVAHDSKSANAKPGAGPRHIAFHPNGRFVYVNNEIDSTVGVFSYEEHSGALHSSQTCSTIPLTFTGHNLSAEISVDSAGKFCYVSNRGHDSIVVFAIAAGNGFLSRIQEIRAGGHTPRSFAIDPTGNWLIAANQDSNTIVLFQINRDSGQLTSTSKSFEVDIPVCLVFAACR